VMNPEKRRLVLKSLLEFLVVARHMLTMRQGDVLLVTCVLPPALIGIEWVNRLLRRRGLVITLHGEIEGLFDPSLQRPSSYGFWIAKWMRWRKRDSSLDLLVIDDFIKQRLLSSFPEKLAADQVHVAYHPVTAFPGSGRDEADDIPRVAFIGYRTRFKGYDLFEQLAAEIATVRFMAIGGGASVDVRTAEAAPLADNAGYMNEIARCAISFFPYTGGYTCSLSAALLDALSAGVHVLATSRPCFVGMAEYLGPDFVTIVDSPAEARRFISDEQWVKAKRAGQALRLQRLATSHYGLDGVRACFERFCLPSAAAELNAYEH
jgi:hypothetical protein